MGDIYAGKRVLVTGHTGFKGSWLALWLHKLGANVTGLSLPPNTKPSHFELIGLEKILLHIEGNICDLKMVKQVFNAAKPQIVFHLAAQSLVRDSYDNPKGTFDTNIGGTVNILEAVRQSRGVKAVVVITSDKCYENKEWVWGYQENDVLGGHDPYSASKGATEIVCSAYHRSFFDKNGRGPHLGFATARAWNVIGGGDWAKDRIIPDCIRALSQGEPISIRNPNATRPWQHVLDPLAGYLLLAKRLLDDPDHFCGAWNFGPVDSTQIKVIDLANQFVKAWGSGQIIIPPFDKTVPHEAYILRLCIDKATQVLQWKPTLNNKSAIEWTVEWYKAWHEKGPDLRDISLRQINEFEKRYR
jgi:CDP-glucose 4,6-dehydratase